ncbi:MAG: FecR domain-containing protein [Chitinophagaceae bacterium]
MENPDKELLLKYLHNYSQCTSYEIIRAQALLDLPWAQELIKSLSWEEWEQPLLNDERANELHGQWKEKANARIQFGKNKVVGKITVLHRLARLPYAAVWASIFVIAGLAIWQIRKNPTDQFVMIEKVNTIGTPVRYVLPDSSEVYLASGSKVSYSAEFKGKTRDIQLHGEAFFQVTHDKEKPFIIHTGDIETQVLGTSFKVTDYEGRPLEVAVATGKVSVSMIQPDDHKLLATLTPGNKVSWDKKTQKAELGYTEVDYLQQWKTGDLIFDRLDMQYIAAELQHRFGVSIVFADAEVKDNRVSATFSANKPIDKIMNTLKIAGKFTYSTKDNKTFTIYTPE